MPNFSKALLWLTRFASLFWRTLVAMLCLVALVMGVLMMPVVQRWLGDQLEQALERQTGMHVEVGRVRYTPFATLAITNVSIADSLPVVSVKQAKANVALASLWEKALIVQSLEADSIMVMARVNQQGILNLKALMPEPADSSIADSSGLFSLPIRIKRVRTQHCYASLQRPDAPMLSAEDVGFDVSDIRMDSLGFGAKLHCIAFDVPALDVRTSLGADVSLVRDSLRISSLLLSATGSTLRADSVLAVISPGAPIGLSDLHTSDIYVLVGSNYLSQLADRPLPAVNVQTRLQIVNGRVVVPDLFVSTGLYTRLSAEADIWPEWPLAEAHTSKFCVRDFHTNMTDIATLLGNSHVANYDKAVGFISIFAKVDASRAAIVSELELESSAVDVAMDLSAVAYDPEWATAGVFCGLESKGKWDGVFRGHVRADANSEWQWGDIQNVKFDISADHFRVGSLPYSFASATASGNWLDGFLGTQLELQDSAANARAVFYLEDGNSLGSSLLVEDLQLATIGLLPDKPNAKLSLRAGAQAVNIDDPDRAECNFRIQDVAYSDYRDTVSIETIVAEMSNDQDSLGSIRNVSLVSDFGNATLRGRYKFASLADEVLFQMQNPMPALLGEPSRPPRSETQAEFTVSLHSIDNVLHCFLPQFSVSGKIDTHGFISSSDHSSAIYVAADGLSGPNELSASDLHLALVCDGDGMTAGVSSSIMNLPLFGKRKDAHLMADIQSDELCLDFDWLHYKDADVVSHAAGSGRNVVFTQTKFSRDDNDKLVAAISVDRAEVLAQDSIWRLDSCRIVAQDGGLDIHNLCIQSGNGLRKIMCDGRVSASLEDTLALCVRNIFLDDFSPSGESAKFKFRGDLSADAHVSAMLSDMHVSSSLDISRFWILNEDYGAFHANLDWSKEMNNLQTDVAIVTGGLPRAYGGGYIDLQKDSLLLNLKIDSLGVKFLNYYLDNCTENWHGTTSGDLSLHGPLSDVQLDAKLKLNKGVGMTVSVTRVPYFIDHEDSVILCPTDMIFKDIRFADSRGKTGIFSGHISHNMFSGLKTALDFDLPQSLLVLKTTQKESPTYYGTVYGSGRMTVRGPISDIKLYIKAKSGPGSDFSILPLEKGDLSGGSGRLVIRSSKDAELTGRQVEKMTSSLTADLDLDITPDARVKVIVSEEDDNHLEVRGAGALSIALLNDGSLRMNGTYEVRNGMYYFAFQNVLSKKFAINNGGSITWDGEEPYDATLDISATYAGLKASLYDLVPAGTDLPTGDLKKRVPVDVNIFIKNKMRRPDISFGIESRSSQNYSQHTIEQYITSEEEMNRQVYSLLLTGRFYSTQDAGGAGSQAYIGSAASELLSNQLSNLISQNNKYVDVGVRYSPGDEVSNEEYDVALSTQMLNNRLNLSGNIGYGRDASNAASANGSGNNFIGDFDVEFKINDRGNVRAKAYTHANNDIIYETSPTTQGVGVSFQEEFNSFSELLHNIWDTFTHRRKKRSSQRQE